MFKVLLLTAIWSISPFGESKVGIPFGVLQSVNPLLVFIVGLSANILVFPFMIFFLDRFNRVFFKWHWYKTASIWVAKRARKGTRSSMEKYGFWGLGIFVMLPLPGTGVYAGSIATYVLKLDRKKAFIANSVGISVSAAIVLTLSILGYN
jgi:uncharacterized membrane protein